MNTVTVETLSLELAVLDGALANNDKNITPNSLVRAAKIRGFLEATRVHPDAFVDEILYRNNGNLDAADKFFADGNFTIWADAAEYAYDYLENLQEELPACVTDNLNYEGLAEDLICELDTVSYGDGFVEIWG